jgi:hexosaminidase
MIVAWRIVAALAGIAGATAAGAEELSPASVLLPQPASMTVGEGRFALAGATVSAAPGTGAAADRFTDLLARSGGPTLGRAANGGIRFVRDRSVAGAEAYRIVVTSSGATVSASGDAGLFYGAETLWQLAAGHEAVPAVTIADQPAFVWRGMMLDSARHFQPVSYVKQLIDRMAVEKLNIFHWHLTDDQGWRIPIDRYPRLTTIGAWRAPAGAEGRDPKTGHPVRYGGFYTKQDIREVVAYAAARHITIVPEIEMPGHATALIAAYPELASTPHPPTAPSSDWGILPNLVSPRDESFLFLEHVLDEVMALFPGRYIHVGGDEAPKGQWKTDPVAQARIKALGLKDEDALQGWFTARIGAYLQQHGRRLLGWDEILEGGVPADATVMSWRGMDGALKAARLGHDTILAPSPILYLDNRQSTSADEPPGRGEIIDWKRLYGLETAPATLTPEERRHILGLQANLFTEHVRTLDYADRMIWPRAAVAAELAWSSAPRDWTGFAPRLVADMGRWTTLGWKADETPLDARATIDGGAMTLAQPADIGTLRYTTDGSAPTATSPAIAGPIPLAEAKSISAQAFLDGKPLGTVRHFSFGPADRLTRAATDMRFCDHKFPMRLEDDGATDVRRIHWVDAMQACWIWPQVPMDGVTRLSAEVGSVPYNFALGDDIKDVVFRKPETAEGEMQVRQDGCDGPLIASIPLAPAARNVGDTMIAGALSTQAKGPHDLCISFTQRTPDPLWLLDRLTLIPSRP